MRREIRIGLLLAAAALLILSPGAALAGGGAGGGARPLCSGFGAGTEITMRDSCFNGVATFVAAGTRLTVRNEGQIPHSFTAVDGSFDTGLLENSQSETIRVGKAGIVRVYCTLHGTASGEGMAGLLIVGNPAPEAAAAASLTTDLQADLATHDEALRGQLDDQSLALAEIKTEIAGLRETLAAEAQAEAEPAAADTRPVGMAAVGALGLLLGGAAVAVAGRRKAEPSS